MKALPHTDKSAKNVPAQKKKTNAKKPKTRRSKGAKK